MGEVGKQAKFNLNTFSGVLDVRASGSCLIPGPGPGELWPREQGPDKEAVWWGGSRGLGYGWFAYEKHAPRILRH